LVVLAMAAVPSSGNDALARLIRVASDESGFLAEAHPKLRPVETNTDGVFLAGACQSPKDVPDTVAHASAAAAETLSLLSRGEVIISPTTAVVDEELCSGCKTCIALCPYSAISFVERDTTGVAEINEALCKGCGTCVAGCPSGASHQKHYSDVQIYAEIKGLLQL
ncbi:CoB--CoM heterodisulfide reductase iron-sulfur subunit A family protein, partial [bacterium]|nr:CoB--CoM heterodisulfide reductase iron-sulfur subunit A family protein [bacterium]